MAGDWIKLEHATADKPEVFRIAEILAIEPEHVLGCLIRVWTWADQQVTQGNAASVTEKTIDRVSRVSGFGSAMMTAGWLQVLDGGVTFPNFERHNGQTAKARALTAKRVAGFKSKKGNAPVTLDALPREEKRRVKGMNPLNPSCTETAGSPSSVPAGTTDHAGRGEPADTAAVLEFPCDGDPNAWRLSESQLSEWQRLYPALDVLSECRGALAWVLAAPDRRKTARGMTRFLVGWLGRAQNSGARSRPTTAPPKDVQQGKFADLLATTGKGRR